MSKKEVKTFIADIFLSISQILFFGVILINYFINDLFSKSVFISVAGVLAVISVVIFIIKLRIK